MAPRSRRAVLRRTGGFLAGPSLVGAVAGSRAGRAAAGVSRDGVEDIGTPTGTPGATARVVFEPQTADAAGRLVTVDRALVPTGGFVTAHDGGPEGPVIGVSKYLPPGDHDDVAVPIDEDWRITRATGLTAVLYRDGDGDESFDFLGGFDDRPYVADGEPVHDSAVVFSPTPMPTDAPAVPTFGATDTPSPGASSRSSPAGRSGVSATPPGAHGASRASASSRRWWRRARLRHGYGRRRAPRPVSSDRPVHHRRLCPRLAHRRV